MIAYRSLSKTCSLKRRILEATMECFWIPARLLFELWIRLTPSYNLSPEKTSTSQRSPHANSTR